MGCFRCIIYLLNFKLPGFPSWRTDVANLQAMTPQERAEYDENLKIYRDWRNTLEYAVEEAEEKGLKKP